MSERKDDFWDGDPRVQQGLALVDRHWKPLTCLVWLLFAALFIYNRWGPVQLFALGDTDDNLRMAQVRALLAGQDWFDLRQYRLNPPAGADIHWSRLVDLPIAGLILLLRPFTGGAEAERAAVAIAPLIPYLVLLFGAALAVRRLVDRRAFPLLFLALFFAGSTNGMFMPLRIDHHGWQLAILSWVIAGLADPKRARGGATAGLATALSLSIGLELLIYLAIAGVSIVLFWVQDGSEKRRLATYAATLSGGTALGFLLFASYANRQAVCDALSPVWLSDALIGGALLLGITMVSPRRWAARLAAAGAVGIIVALFHAGMWPHCLSRLEGVSAEVEELWLSRVREARPLHTHGWRVALMIAALPITGLIGWAILSWRARTDVSRLRRTLAAAAPAVAATLLLLWQTRTGPAAQMMGAIGAVALVWTLLPLTRRPHFWLLRHLGFAALLLVGLGAVVPLSMDYFPAKKRTPREIAIARANAACNSLPGLRAVAMQPKGMVFSFVDLGPRLITATHHNAVIGPYHRNGEQIADVMKAFRGSPDQARAIMAKYKADYLLICPNSSTTTIFMAETPNGFYGQLQKGQVPNWLDPVELPGDSPFRMWRIRR